MSLLLVLVTGLGQGLLHAMGPDHCAAMATLAAGGEGRRRAAVLTALRFAVGHAVALAAIAGVCLLTGVVLSEAFERWAEIGSGLVLIGLAAAALLYPSAFEHGHPHLGAHGPSHRHGLPLATGALMAVSGVRALTLALPPLLLGGGLGISAAVYLPAFAVGVLAGMSAFGLAVGEGLHRAGAARALRLRQAAAALSALVGVLWIGRQL